MGLAGVVETIGDAIEFVVIAGEDATGTDGPFRLGGTVGAEGVVGIG